MSEIVKRIDEASKQKAYKAFDKLKSDLLKLVPSNCWVTSSSLNSHLDSFCEEHREKIVEHFEKEFTDNFFRDAEALFFLIKESK